MTHPIERNLVMTHLTDTLFIAIVSRNEEVGDDAKALSLRIATHLCDHDVDLCKRRAMRRVRKFEREQCVRRPEPLPP